MQNTFLVNYLTFPPSLFSPHTFPSISLPSYFVSPTTLPYPTHPASTKPLPSLNLNPHQPQPPPSPSPYPNNALLPPQPRPPHSTCSFISTQGCSLHPLAPSALYIPRFLPHPLLFDPYPLPPPLTKLLSLLMPPFSHLLAGSLHT